MPSGVSRDIHSAVILLAVTWHFLHPWLDFFAQFWKILSPYLFKYSLASFFLFFLVWDANTGNLDTSIWICFLNYFSRLIINSLAVSDLLLNTHVLGS